jgi:AraC-like DNA-binding protein/quercetin dioxygenase-like cupin family protein
MKPFVQKLPLNENTSFVARTYRTPNFEVSWHQHIEYELIAFTEGTGLCFIGNHVGEFQTGDVFFLGSNLPHTFQKRDKEAVASAVVVQFRDDFWGTEFLALPESRAIRELLAASSAGLKIRSEPPGLPYHQRTGRTAVDTLAINQAVRRLEQTTGFERIIGLCQCLSRISQEDAYLTLSTQEVVQPNGKDKERIDRVFQFTIDSFQQPIALADVAALTNMSVPAFCGYFKRSTKKTYIDFLNEIRVGHACTMLQHSTKNITQICYTSGYNTLANFNKQFLHHKAMTPSAYRRLYREMR